MKPIQDQNRAGGIVTHIVTRKVQFQLPKYLGVEIVTVSANCTKRTREMAVQSRNLPSMLSSGGTYKPDAQAQEDEVCC